MFGNRTPFTQTRTKRPSQSGTPRAGIIVQAVTWTTAEQKQNEQSGVEFEMNSKIRNVLIGCFYLGAQRSISSASGGGLGIVASAKICRHPSTTTTAIKQLQPALASRPLLAYAGKGLSVTSYGDSDNIEPGGSLQTSSRSVPGLLKEILTRRQLFTTVQSKEVGYTYTENRRHAR
jgi:hypothetical protein